MKTCEKVLAFLLTINIAFLYFVLFTDIIGTHPYSCLASEIIITILIVIVYFRCNISINGQFKDINEDWRGK